MASAELGDAGASRLVDVTQFPLDRLISDGETVLLRSLRRLLIEIDRPDEVLSAFDNYAGDPPEVPSDPASSS